MNKPGIITRVQQLADFDHNGRSIHAAYLHVTFGDGRIGAIYAASCLPNGPGPHPAVVHCPGGGQGVYPEDLAWWAGHGFACVAFDWQIGHWQWNDPSRKSCWPPRVTIQDVAPREWDQAVLPMAVQGVGAAIDWLTTMPTVDTTRIGCTGISWGGYLCWLAGVCEPRLRAIAPVYGCGGLFAPEREWVGAATPLVERYRAECDPVALAGSARAPVAYLGAANDFFGWPAVADSLLDEVPVTSRRSWVMNVDHGVLPAQSLLAVAWMRQHLADGPAVPATPQWKDGKLEIDHSAPVKAVHPWWTPSFGPDDTRCWWPGEPPPTAPVVARCASVLYADGFLLSSAVVPATAEERARPTPDLGDRWPDPLAGLGIRSGTQLRDNGATIEPDGAGGARLWSERGEGFSSYAPADPRWNRPGFAGFRMRLTGVEPGRNIGVTLCAFQGAKRPSWRGEVTLGADGVVCVDRTTVPLPADIPWSAVFKANFDGMGAPRFTIAGLNRIMEV